MNHQCFKHKYGNRNEKGKGREDGNGNGNGTPPHRLGPMDV